MCVYVKIVVRVLLALHFTSPVQSILVHEIQYANRHTKATILMEK